jgi:hypothetical protein
MSDETTTAATTTTRIDVEALGMVKALRVAAGGQRMAWVLSALVRWVSQDQSRTEAFITEARRRHQAELLAELEVPDGA